MWPVDILTKAHSHDNNEEFKVFTIIITKQRNQLFPCLSLPGQISHQCNKTRVIFAEQMCFTKLSSRIVLSFLFLVKVKLIHSHYKIFTK